MTDNALGVQQEKPLILIVDDVPRNLQVLASVLGSAGYEIAAANLPSRALKTLESIVPDLILLDVMMPEMSGFELCKKIKTIESIRDVPVIFLTAKTATEDLVVGFESGGVDYVTKPFNHKELLTRVKTHIDLRRSREVILAKNREIEEINRHLTDSINYARHIQQSILPKKNDIKSIFPESFVYLKPRDIVSGDFFWVSRGGNKVIIAAVDCTGHGVPGAFISILAYQLMNDIIILREETRPDEILNLLQSGIVKVFNRQDSDIYGGMDIALCSLDLDSRVLEFAGAKNSLIYIYDNELDEIKGDKFSIGGGFKRSKDRVFGKHTLNIKESTMLYLFSDGFPDQLGEKDRRFSRNQFRELLEKIHGQSMEQQRRALEESLSRWMSGEYEQIDDILVLGFKW